MRTQTEARPRGRVRRRGSLARSALTVLAVGAVVAGLPAAPATSSTGGTSTEPSGPTGKAKLRNGKAVAPVDAPKRVVKAIEAANKIVKGKGYCLGGGHRRFKSKCYDCSGAVSYALKGGRMLNSPLPSGPLARWGKKGKGEWLTVYAHGGHAYAVIAGLRLDTSMTKGKGPGWSKRMRSTRGYKARHYKGY